MRFKIPFINKSTILLRLIFIASLVIFCIMAMSTFKHFKSLNKSTDLLIHSYEINTELERIMSHLKDAETGFRGYLLYKDTIFLTPYNSSRENVNKSFIRLKKLMADEAIQQQNLKELYHLIVVRYSYFNKNYTETNAYLHYYVYNGQNAMDKIREKIDEMKSIEMGLLNKRSLKLENTTNETPFYAFIILIFTLFLIIIAFLKLSRNMKSLRTNVNKLKVLNDINSFGEKIGKYGSWKYNHTSKSFTLSDNLYCLLGASPQDFEPVLDEFLKFVHPDSVEIFTDMVYKIANNIEIKELEFKIIKADGETRYFKTVGKRTTNKVGDHLIVGTVLDFTEEHFKNKQIEERNKELEQNNKELSGFNYIASHDLQEPLRKIQTLISIIEEKEKANLTENGQAYFERIVTSVERMRTLIDDLLQYSGTNRKDNTFEVVDLNEIVNNTKLELSQAIEDKNAIITSEQLPTVKAIPFQIQQLFNNLISNAIKYSIPNSIPEISIAYSKIIAKNEPDLISKSRKEYYKIEFKDNGLGFEQKNAEKIFLLFNRLYNKNEYPGTGVGLAICKKIIENHNGFINAKSKPNKGATFTIYLPIA
jgi:signal transduction histidine kinase/CHASE3 domain sensor protein